MHGLRSEAGIQNQPCSYHYFSPCVLGVCFGEGVVLLLQITTVTAAGTVVMDLGTETISTFLHPQHSTEVKGSQQTLVLIRALRLGKSLRIPALQFPGL